MPSYFECHQNYANAIKLAIDNLIKTNNLEGTYRTKVHRNTTVCIMDTYKDIAVDFVFAPRPKLDYIGGAFTLYLRVFSNNKLCNNDEKYEEMRKFTKRTWHFHGTRLAEGFNSTKGFIIPSQKIMQLECMSEDDIAKIMFDIEMKLSSLIEKSMNIKI